MVAEFSPTTMVITTADFVIVRHHTDATVVLEIIIYGFVLFLFLQAIVSVWMLYVIFSNIIELDRPRSQ
jgi:hypothetical protein